MDFENIIVEIETQTATITINRPKKLNALNKKTLEELHLAFDQLNKNEAVKVILLTGVGEKAFVAGADISEFANFSVEEGAKLAEEGQEKVFNFIENLATPVIALINGFALGGGLELAMACHFRIASDNAKMGLPETSLGVIPGYGGTQRLPQLIGKGKAMELIMTAAMLNANEAKSLGLVNYTVRLDELFPLGKKIAAQICKNSPTAISKVIKAINANYNEQLNGYTTEIKLFGNCFRSKDFIEGTSAFLEKIFFRIFF